MSMRAPVGLALFTLPLWLPLWACLSAPQPADPGAGDASAQGDGNASADADPNRSDASPVGGELVCDSSSSTPFGRSYLIPPSSGNYAQIGDDAHQNLDLAGSFTLEAWLNFAELPVTGVTYSIISKDDFGGAITGRGYFWYVERDGSNIAVRCRVAQPGGGRGSEIQWLWPEPEAGAWHHFAVVFDVEQSTVTSSLRLLIDGQAIPGLNTNDEVDQLAVNDSSAAFTIGAWQNNGTELAYFAGAIDEVRVWDHARTDLQVQGARLEPLVGTEAGLVGYWQFEDDLADSSSSGNTLVGLSPEYCAGPSN